MAAKASNTGQAKFPRALEFLFRKHRYKVAWGGRGSGKSWGFARAILILGAKRPIRVLCSREVQRSIKDSVHKLLSDQIKALKLSKKYDVLDTVIRGKNGTEIMFAGLGSQTTDSIKSFEGVDICWVEEGQSITKRSWDILTPTIRKAGSEIWISMNPELETDETYQRFVKHPPPDSVVVCVNHTENPWFTAELEAERQHAKLTMTPDDYANIWEGKCRKAAAGAIYAAQIEAAEAEARIRPVPYDPLLAVHCIWDLGWNDQMTIVMVQQAASQLRVIDYIEDSHHTLEWYVAELRKRPYTNWGIDWLPHDGTHKNIQTGKSAKETLEALQRQVEITPNMGVEDGIRATRTVFARVFFDETKAARLVECLRRYKRSINQQTNEPGAPVHDEFSHGADAFRYMAINADKLTSAIERTSHPIFNDPRFAAGRSPATYAGY